jgi:hypothetical protein
MAVAVLVGTINGAGVGRGVRVAVDVSVAFDVAVAVGVPVADGVAVTVGVPVADGVAVTVGVPVADGVAVAVAVPVTNSLAGEVPVTTGEEVRVASGVAVGAGVVGAAVGREATAAVIAWVAAGLYVDSVAGSGPGWVSTAVAVDGAA